MVLCLLALPIFALLGLFSIKYRSLARESLQCLFRTITLRKCQSGLDTKIKSYVTGKSMKKSAWLARFIFRYYKPLSWLVLLVFVWSAYASSVGLYNYYYYGNCNGPESTGFCVFDPTGQNSGVSEIEGTAPASIVYPQLESDDPIIGPINAELTIIEFGCYVCPYTRKAEPIVAEVLTKYAGRVNVQFKNFPIPSHTGGTQMAIAANCAHAQGKYPAFHEAAMTMPLPYVDSMPQEIATHLGLDIEAFTACIQDPAMLAEVQADQAAGVAAEVYGTPTFFIGQQKIVGPKPLKTFQTLIDKELS